MWCEMKYKLIRSHNTRYCLIEVVTKAGLGVYSRPLTFVWTPNLHSMLTQRHIRKGDMWFLSSWVMCPPLSSCLPAKCWQPETLSRNERGRFGALKSDSTHHFFRNARTKSGSLRFSQFSGCWLILSVYMLMSFDFPFVRLFGVR